MYLVFTYIWLGITDVQTAQQKLTRMDQEPSE